MGITGAVSGRRALLLDIDGTLTRRSSGEYLAERMGHLESVRVAEAAYAAGRIDNGEVCSIDALGWAGHRVEVVDGWLDAMPVLDGVDGVEAWATVRDIVVVLASVAWRPVSESLSRRFGFHVSGGPEVEVRDGRYTGVVRATFDEFDKRDVALATALQLGVEPEGCIAVGDSRSDLPLFEAVGLSVALNASAELRRHADLSVMSSDFSEVLRELDTVMRSG